jgi:hypothetical protein
MSLSELIPFYGTEAKCEAALERARWPDGFVCSECGAREHCSFLVEGRRYWQCSHCRVQTSLCSGTLFHASNLPLTKWFQAIYLVTQNKNNLSALSLKRHLGVSYSTGWRVKHKLLEPMRYRESRRLLEGVVFADDSVLRGEPTGKPGRGSENKAPSMAAVELDEDGYPQHLRFGAIEDYKGETSPIGRNRHCIPRLIWSPTVWRASTLPASKLLRTARSSSVTATPAIWSHSIG